MAATGPGIMVKPARIWRSLAIGVRFAALGPMFGALAVMGAMVVLGVPKQGLNAIAPVAGFSWLFVIVAYFIALAPAALTGLFAGLEFLLRGRVSWLGAIVAGLLAMHINHVLTGNTFLGPGLYWIGALASVCVRACFGRSMVGADLPEQTLTVTTGGVRHEAAEHAIGGRLMLALAYIAAVPPLVALPYTVIGASNPFRAVDAGSAFMLSLVLGSVGAILLAIVTRPGTRVRLLDAMWTQLPGWGLVVLNGRQDRDELVLLMLIALAATAGVTLALGKRIVLGGRVHQTPREPVWPVLQAWLFPAPQMAAPLQPLLRVKSRKLRTFLIFVAVVPPLSVIAATPFMELPAMSLIMLIGIIPPYVVFGLPAITAGLLLGLLTPRGSEVALLHAAWTPLPGMAIAWMGASQDRIFMMAGFTFACMAASVTVAAIFHRWLAEPV